MNLLIIISNIYQLNSEWFRSWISSSAFEPLSAAHKLTEHSRKPNWSGWWRVRRWQSTSSLSRWAHRTPTSPLLLPLPLSTQPNSSSSSQILSNSDHFQTVCRIKLFSIGTKNSRTTMQGIQSVHRSATGRLMLPNDILHYISCIRPLQTLFSLFLWSWVDIGWFRHFLVSFSKFWIYSESPKPTLWISMSHFLSSLIVWWVCWPSHCTRR